LSEDNVPRFFFCFKYDRRIFVNEEKFDSTICVYSFLISRKEQNGYFKFLESQKHSSIYVSYHINAPGSFPEPENFQERRTCKLAPRASRKKQQSTVPVAASLPRPGTIHRKNGRTINLRKKQKQSTHGKKKNPKTTPTSPGKSSKCKPPQQK